MLEASFPQSLFQPSRVDARGFRTRGFDVNVVDVFKTYRVGRSIEVPALRGVVMNVKQGSIVSLMGPSGSGKTTLLNLIGGIDKPTSGSIFVGNVDVSKLDESVLEKYRLCIVGYVFQSLNLIPVLSALENVALPLIAFNVPRQVRVERARWLLELVGLSDRAHHKPHELSGGQQQRVAIAVALANDPPLILADEPTAELDSVNAKNIVSLLVDLSRKFGKTVIVATHDPKIAVETDVIYRLEDGRITGAYKPVEFTEIKATLKSSLVDTVKSRLIEVEEEIRRLVEAFSRGLIKLEDFNREYTKLRNIYEALKELERSSGF